MNKLSLEETIISMGEFAEVISAEPKYIPLYNLMLTGVCVKYNIDRKDLITKMYANWHNNNK